jgi:GntR family transcriptional regulator, gluconate operon transcriptional repressor
MAHASRSVRRTGLGEQVAWDLRLRIFGRNLGAGAHLVEDQLATQYDVSRGPIRDALKELQAEGLVETLGKRGTFVVEQTDSDIEELLSLRTAIETLGTVVAMRVAETDDWVRLRRCVDQMGVAAHRGDYADFTHADMNFHNTMYQVSRHRRLLHVWNLYQKTFTALLQLANQDDLDANLAVASHTQLLDIMRSGDENEVREIVETYIENSRSHVMATIATPQTPPDSGPRAVTA